MNKLAFCGKAGCGKDYLTNILETEYKFVRFSFSDQLKDICSKIFPWMEKDYPPLQKEKLHKFDTGFEIIEKTPREIWILMNSIRKIEPNIFVRKLDEKIKMTRVNNIIISDLRTENELEYLKKNNYKIIFIKPQKEIYKENKFDEELKAFEEVSDYVYYNNFDGKESFKKFITENNIV